MTNEIEEKVYDVSIIVKELDDFPHCYNTILVNLFKNGTLQYILRRKLSKLVKQRIIKKCTIPGTRCGKCMYYAVNKKYYIMVCQTRVGVDVFYFFDFKKLSKHYMKVEEYWILEKLRWKKMTEPKIFFEGDALLFL